MSTFWKCCNGNYPAHEKSCDNAPPSPLDQLAQAILDGRVYLEVVHIMDDVVHSWKIYVEEEGE